MTIRPFRTRFALVLTALAGACVAVAALPASAQQTGQDRFSLVTTKDGVIRVDKQTGAVTFCRQTGTALKCVLAADERQAWQAETESLAQQIKSLEGRIAALEGTGAGAPNAPAQPESGGPAVTPDQEEGLFSKKTQKEIDQAVETAERVLRGLVGAMKELGNELAEDLKTR